MKRAFGLGLGVAWASVSAAADPVSVSVHPTISTASQPAPLPPGLKYAGMVMPAGGSAVTGTGIAAVAAEQPVSPTVPAPYPTTPSSVVPGPTVVTGQTGVADGTPGSGCSTCAGTTGRTHGSVAGRIAGWLCFQPAPPVLPRFVPTPYQAPLLSYFPSSPDRVGPPPDIKLWVGGPSIVPKQIPPGGAVPLVYSEGTTPPASAPTTKPAEPTAPAPGTGSEKTEAPEPRRTTWWKRGGDTKVVDAPVVTASRPRVVEVAPATDTGTGRPRLMGRLLDLVAPVDPVTVTVTEPATPVRFSGPASTSETPRTATVPVRTSSPPVIQPVSAPRPATRSEAGPGSLTPAGGSAKAESSMPVARGQAPGLVVDEPVLPVGPPPVAGCVPCAAGADPVAMLALAKVFANCERHSFKAPCTGHGDLSGYRFASPLVFRCPPFKPLLVKDCSGGAGAACAGGACPAPSPAGGPVPMEYNPYAKATKTPAPAAPKAEKSSDAVAAARPFTSP